MTTIATDGISMACDGLVHDHCDTITDFNHQKIFRLPDGRIAGGAGNVFDVDSWVQWLADGCLAPCPIESERFNGLILNLDGTVLWVDHKGRAMPSPAPCAVGSGQDFALAAMDCGAAPYMAVSIACARDVYSGGQIRVLTLGED